MKPYWLIDQSTFDFTIKITSDDPGFSKRSSLFKEGAALGSQSKIKFKYDRNFKVVIEADQALLEYIVTGVPAGRRH